MKFSTLLRLLALAFGIVTWTSAPAAETREEFAQRIITRMRFSEPEKTERIIAATVSYLDSLERILEERAKALQTLETAPGQNGKPDSDEVVKAYAHAKSQYLPLRSAYVKKLESDLVPYLVERAKDGLTHDALPNLYAMYLEMVPQLKPAEKAHILGLLVEARENAMTATDSKGQHQWFAKYRGIINNYIAAQGYDFKALSRAWDAAHPES